MSLAAIPTVRLDDRLALITGAARGMGAAHARTSRPAEPT